MKKPHMTAETKKDFFVIAIIEPDKPFATFMIFPPSSFSLHPCLQPLSLPLPYRLIDCAQHLICGRDHFRVGFVRALCGNHVDQFLDNVDI